MKEEQATGAVKITDRRIHATAKGMGRNRHERQHAQPNYPTRSMPLKKVSRTRRQLYVLVPEPATALVVSISSPEILKERRVWRHLVL